MESKENPKTIAAAQNNSGVGSNILMPHEDKFGMLRDLVKLTGLNVLSKYPSEIRLSAARDAWGGCPYP